MPLLMKHTGPLWGIWKIEESSEVLLSLLRNREEYLPQLELIRTEQRRREWLACRVLLQELTGGPVCVAYRPNGAPYLSGSSLHISISHTKGYVSVILSDKVPVGIDIEQYGQRVHRVAHKYMREDESVRLYKEDATWSLLLHWCAKETLFKMIGQEEVDFLHHLHVRPFPYAEEGSFTVYETRTEEGAVYRLDYLVTPDFVLTRS